MNFYYSKIPDIPAGIVQTLDALVLEYEPYRSEAHYQLLKDLELGLKCDCKLEDKGKVVVTKLLSYGKLKVC